MYFRLPARVCVNVLSALAVLSSAGCASLSEPTEQSVLVQTVLDHRQIGGVGCVLYNDAGKWFVTTPGRVTLRKSSAPLRIDCKKEGVGAAREVVASEFGTGKLIGNAVLSAGLGYYVDRRSGAGFDYPATLTVMLQPVAATPGSPGSPGSPDPAAERGVGTPVY